MEIVIKIHDIPTNNHERWILKYGIPLPKHHGRLIDVDELLDDIGLEDNDENRVCNTGEIITLEDIDRISIIIPATKEGEIE